MSRLDALLWAPDGRTHVLAGPGGAGKTAIALWLAREAARRGVPAWWVPATDTTTVTVRLLELAACIGARPGELAQAKAGQRGAADLLWRYLEQRSPWLLVLDGADNPAVLTAQDADLVSGTDWLRRTQVGLIVVTSRASDRSAWGRHTEVHAVGRLGQAAGAQLLTDLAPAAEPADEAAALSESLGGVPLALWHAGSLLASEYGRDGTGGTFAGYARAHGERAGRPGAGDDDRAIVTSTRELALEALAAGGRPQARPLLRVLGCLAPGVVIGSAMLDPGVLARVCEHDREAAAEGLSALADAGLITRLPDGDVVVHPLVAEGSRVYTGDAALSGGVAVAMLAAGASRLDARQPADWPAWLGLLPHLGAATGYLGGMLARQDLAVLSDVAAAAVAAFLKAGSYRGAADLAASALRHASRLGAEHESVLALRNGAARARAALGRGGEAERELRDLLAAQTRVLGPDHPDTLGTGRQLARLLARQGQYEWAQERLRDLLAAHSRALGPDHPDTLTARHDFGLVLAQRGEYAQAEREFSDLLAARVRVLGPGHRDTRVTQRWLAHVAAAVVTVPAE